MDAMNELKNIPLGKILLLDIIIQILTVKKKNPSKILRKSKLIVNRI